MRKIPIAILMAVAHNRPAGYAEDFISQGRLEDDILLLQDAVYLGIMRKYSRVPSIKTRGRNLAKQFSPTQKQPKSIFPQPIPRKDWPLWAKALSMVAKPEDKGIGDVVARTVGAENSEAFKKWFKATTGKDCGCTGRQRRWNIEYPL